MENKKTDKLLGMMTGLAIGDAMGAPAEFKVRGTFPYVDSYQDGGTHNLAAGYWTDDTSMALCSAISLILMKRFDPNDQLDRFLRWYRDGYQSSTGVCFDIGNQTRVAITAYEETKTPYSFNGENSAGNGPLMRLAPIVVFYHDDTKSLIQFSAKSAMLTHSDKRCSDSAIALSLILKQCMSATNKSEALDCSNVLAEALMLRGGPLHEEVRAVVAGSYKRLSSKNVKSSGYVVSSLETALWAFYKASSFEEGLELAVNLGGDADTIGSIYGQIAGAFWGYHSIPSALVEGLFDHNRIISIASVLATGITETHLNSLVSDTRISLPNNTSEPESQTVRTAGAASYHSWEGLKGFPQNTEELLLGLQLTDKEKALISKGWVPDDMGEKMFMYFENETLFMHSSWNGEIAYALQFSGNEIVKATVNPDCLNVESHASNVAAWIYALIERNSKVF